MFKICGSGKFWTLQNIITPLGCHKLAKCHLTSDVCGLMSTSELSVCQWREKGSYPELYFRPVLEVHPCMRQIASYQSFFSIYLDYEEPGLLRQSFPKSGEVNFSLCFSIASTGFIWLSWALRAGHRKCVMGSWRPMEGTWNKKSSILTYTVMGHVAFGSADKGDPQTDNSLKVQAGTEAQFRKPKW